MERALLLKLSRHREESRELLMRTATIVSLALGASREMPPFHFIAIAGDLKEGVRRVN